MKFTFPNCGGCSTCELACSFKFSGSFTRNISALTVTHREDGGYEVEIFEEQKGEHRTCDGCLEFDEPMCMRYCHESLELKKYIDQIREKIADKDEINND